MNRHANIEPYAWATKEPEMPPKETRSPASSAPDAAATAGAGADGQTGDLPRGVGADSTHAFVWRHAGEAAAVVRALMARDGAQVAHEGLLAGLRARQVAAAFLCGLGYEVGARVVRELYLEGEVEWVARAVVEEPPVTHATAMAALDHVRRRIEAGDYLERSGADFAGDLLHRAFGDPRARRLLPREEKAAEFGFLREAPPAVVAPYVAREHPQTIALLLSQLDSHLGAAILEHLPERLQADVSYRVATLEAVPPEVLRYLDKGLAHSMSLVFGRDVEVGGPGVLADLLNLASSRVERNVLDQLDAQAPAVAEATRNLMFTFADIARMTDREVQTFLREVDPKDLAIALKVARAELADKLLRNTSDEARAIVVDEMEGLGPMRLSEVEAVQRRCVQQVRQLEEQGKVAIVRGDLEPFV